MRADDDFLTDAYRDRISTYCESNSGYEFDLVVSVFRHDCESFHDLFTDDASLEDVRRVAWNQTKNRLQTGKVPEDLRRASD